KDVKLHSLLSGSFDDLVVRGASVEPRQELPRLRGNDGDFIVVARKRPHRIQGIEPHDRHEFNAIINVPAEQMDASIALD
ncbi:MAG: hypothetical protein AAB253_04655, partial [candidate division NC10 bacterium]